MYLSLFEAPGLVIEKRISICRLFLRHILLLAAVASAKEVEYYFAFERIQ